jgi:hypothetical protein
MPTIPVGAALLAMLDTTEDHLLENKLRIDDLKEGVCAENTSSCEIHQKSRNASANLVDLFEEKFRECLSNLHL